MYSYVWSLKDLFLYSFFKNWLKRFLKNSSFVVKESNIYTDKWNNKKNTCREEPLLRDCRDDLNEIFSLF